MVNVNWKQGHLKIAAVGASPSAFRSPGLRCSGKMPDMNGRAWLGIGEAFGRMAFNFIAGSPFHRH